MFLWSWQYDGRITEKAILPLSPVHWLYIACKTGPTIVRKLFFAFGALFILPCVLHHDGETASFFSRCYYREKSSWFCFTFGYLLHQAIHIIQILDILYDLRVKLSNYLSMLTHSLCIFVFSFPSCEVCLALPGDCNIWQTILLC